MTDITEISTNELIEDLATSQIELDTCRILILTASECDREQLRERIDGNTSIIAVIKKELNRRSTPGRVSLR